MSSGIDVQTLKAMPLMDVGKIVGRIRYQRYQNKKLKKEDDIYFLIGDTIVLIKSQKLLSHKLSQKPKGIFFQKLNSMLQQDRFGESIYPCNVSSLLLFQRLVRF